VTWINDFDLGASQNLHNAVFMEAVAGDPGRAAVGSWVRRRRATSGD